MSTATTYNGASYAPNKSVSTEHTNNPFDTVFDHDEDNEDDWCDEDTIESISSNKAIMSHKRQSSGVSIPTGLGLVSAPASRISTRRVDKRYSVQKPTRDKSRGRQKKQNAKAGIKVVTNFSRHQPAEAPVQLQPAQLGKFVDLAALQALNGGSSQQSGGFWRSKKTRKVSKEENNIPRNESLVPTSNDPIYAQRVAGKKMYRLPPPLRLNEDLSPNDRPIVIGLSIPSASLARHAKSPDTAGSTATNVMQSYEHRTPTNQELETPTIIIAPARESMGWTLLDITTQSTFNPYSHSSNTYSHEHENAPPIPAVPASFLDEERQRTAAQRSYFSPDSDDATNWDDEEVPSSRVVSSCTIFEEDESPILTRNERSGSLGVKSWDRSASINTVATKHRSQGWWNYITTPFLSRSNTFASHKNVTDQPPPLPDLAIAAAKAQDAERENKKWDKQFSPFTPATSTTIASDTWWNTDSKVQRPQVPSPVIQEARRRVQTASVTLPMIFTGAETGNSSGIVSQHATPRLPSPEPVSATSESETIRGDSSQRAIQSNHPFIQPQTNDSSLPSLHNEERTMVSEPRRQSPVAVSVSVQVAQPTPPPPYSPPPRRYRAILPPGHTTQEANNSMAPTQQPLSPGPLSPGLQEIMSSRGDIPMSSVPLTPPPRRMINLNSGYPELPMRANGGQFITQDTLAPSKKAAKAEAKRQRYEKEDALAHKAGGWWRGRGCIPKNGCYGRSGAEGRKRRRCYLALIIGLLAMIILAVVLATTLHRKSNTVIEPTQWLNLTRFPPIFLGMSTVIAPVNIVTNAGCIIPSSVWSCDLPQELQTSVAPNGANQPNFFFYTQWDNSSSANATFANVTGNPNLVTRNLAGNPVSAGLLIKRLLRQARDIVTFVPSPAPPIFAEEFFLGNTTDGIVSSLKAGEPTPFYISLLPSANSTIAKRQLVARAAVITTNTTNPFPNITFPAPSLNADATAAAANLVPFPNQQPVMLFDRGLESEHYGFYSYYDRSIFLSKEGLVNGTGEGVEVGGVREEDAAFRCTWAETRFLVQIWTRRNGTARLLNGTHVKNTKTAATDLSQPGSFPYPVTMTADRHGGDPEKKMVYCYALDSKQGLIASSAKLQVENRGFGGVMVNPASNSFANTSDSSLGGFDGGSGGCSCAWSNFVNVAS